MRFTATFFVLLGFSAQADNCAEIRSDYYIMKEQDKTIAQNFFREHGATVTALASEVTDTLNLVRQVLVNDNPSLSKLAQTMKEAAAIGKNPSTRDIQLLGSKVMRILPPFLNKNWFQQVSNLTGQEGKLVPVFAWDEAILKDIESGRIGNRGYYNSTLKRVKRDQSSAYVPVINQPAGFRTMEVVINQEFDLFLTNKSEDRKPWEVAIYGALSTAPKPTVLPPTYLNQNRNLQGNYDIWMQTQPLILDLSNGMVRKSVSRDLNFEDHNGDFLDSNRNVIATASVKGPYLQQLWNLEEKVKTLCRQ